MGLESYNGTAKTIVFRCRECERLGDDPLRTIAEGDMELYKGENFVGVQLPDCPNCGTRSLIVPGTALQGPISHLRAVLLNRLYEAGGGDGNGDLSDYKPTVDALKTSYTDKATTEANDQFLGNADFETADKGGQPIAPE